MAKRRIIWSDDINIDDWVGDREEIMEDRKCCAKCKKKDDCARCDHFYREVSDLNSNYLDDEIANLKVDIGRPIVAIADLGLWDGRKSGIKFIGHSLNCIFTIFENGYNTYYADGRNVRSDHSHHDGTNHILYRKLKPNITEEQLRTLFVTKWNYTWTPERISQYTQSILPDVAKVYGW